MEFFLGDEPLNRNMPEYKKLKETGVELAYLMSKKYEGVNLGYKIIKHSFVENDIHKTSYFFGKLNNDEESRDKVSTFFSPSGFLVGGAITRLNITDSKFEVVKAEDIVKLLNPEIVSIADAIYKDFFILKKTEVVKDKKGDEYTLKIIQNSDSTIGDVLYIDEVLLFKGDEKIGYLKAKYTTKELLKKYNGLGDSGFGNVATIDYSKLRDDMKGKGLGYVMYFHMAKHLNEESIKFRQSTICSPSAQRLWSAFENHCADVIEEKEWSSGGKIQNIKFLNIAKNLVLSFKENVPTISKKNKI